MRVFPYLHLFLNETFELTSRVLIFKKKRRRGKKPNITFSSKCLLKLSCRLVSRAHAVLCASVCEVALSLSLLFFLLPFYICSTCFSHSSYLKSPVHFFFLKETLLLFVSWVENEGKAQNEKREANTRHTHTHIKNNKKKKTQAASLKQNCRFEMSQILFSVSSGHQGVRSVFPCLFPLLTFSTERQRRFKLVHIGHLSSSDSKHLQVFA